MVSFIAQIPDDRITCATDCANFSPGASRCKVDNGSVVPDILRRCEHFRPLSTSSDKRTGKQRWSHLMPASAIGRAA